MLDSRLIDGRSRIARPPDGSCIILDSPRPPKPEWVPTPESFERLLLWLSPDRERAGETYEQIRIKLIKRFRQLEGSDPEFLTDQTINRVMQKLPQILAEWKGDPAAYFFSVAFYIHQEDRRKHLLLPLPLLDLPDPNQSKPPDLLDDQEDDDLLECCLKECLEKQAQHKREMIVEYYRGDRNEKIRRRKELAAKQNIKLPNLRLKAQRVRSDLKKCILDCMKRKQH